jgi:hypothetical protein
MILEPWHPPYYRERIEALGWQDDGPADVVARARRLKQGTGSTTRSMRSRTRSNQSTGSGAEHAPKDIEAEIGRFMESTTRRGEELGVRPDHRGGGRFQAQNLKQILDERWTFIAERTVRPGRRLTCRTSTR